MERRTLLKAGGLGLIAVVGAGGAVMMLSPREAREHGAPLKVLKPAEAKALEAFGEALLPGAAAAGIAHFIDAQIACDPADSLLVLRYFDWPAPYDAFYHGGIAALDAVAKAAFSKTFAELDAKQAETLTGQIATGAVKGWQGPPPPLFYMAARSDAVDVVYGTMEGFQKLGVPYMAHIEPEHKW